MKLKLFAIAVAMLASMESYGSESVINSIDENIDSTQVSISSDSLVTSEKRSSDLNDKRNTIYANFGYSYIYSKVYGDANISGHVKSGYDFQLGYDWVSRKGFGFGFILQGFKSTYHYLDYPEHMIILYLAPQFVMEQRLGNSKFHLKERLGFGYCYYEDYLIDREGLGYNCQVDLEYRLTPSFGISATTGCQTTLFLTDDPNLADDEQNGISRWFISLGVRWHF